MRYFEGNILEPSSATTATDSTITSSNIPPVPTNTSGATPATDSTINSGDTPPVPTTTSNATTITSSDTAVVPTTTSSAVPLNASSLEDMKIKYKYLISIKNSNDPNLNINQLKDYFPEITANSLSDSNRKAIVDYVQILRESIFLNIRDSLKYKKKQGKKY